jgi:hypothetical protein
VIGAFNTAVTALQGFFSKLFWFGVFVPVALFAALHLGLAMLTFPDVHAAVTSASARGAEEVRLVGAILGLIVLAFLLSPLLPLLRGLLDGSLLPASVCQSLVEARVGKVRRQRAELRSARDTAGAIQQIVKEGRAKLKTAYNVGRQLPTAVNMTATIAAEIAIAAASKPLESAKLPGLVELDKAIIATDRALRANNPDQADLAKLDPKAEVGLSERTGRAGDKLEMLLADAESEATGRYEVAEERLRGIPTDGSVQATHMGDARRAAERYAIDTYGVEFTFLYPRLLIHLPKGGSAIADRLIAAQAALDAAVMSVFLAATLFVWLVVLAAHGQSVTVLLLIALGTPTLIWGCLRLAIEAQFGLGEAVNLAVDRHRFDVLKELRQPIPTSRLAERALWARLGAAAADPRTVELPYVPPVPEREG